MDGWVLDMVECYPVEAFSLPSVIVGLGDSCRFTAAGAESTQIRGQNVPLNSYED
jgi:hypothetical protein